MKPILLFLALTSIAIAAPQTRKSVDVIRTAGKDGKLVVKCVDVKGKTVICPK